LGENIHSDERAEFESVREFDSDYFFKQEWEGARPVWP